MQQPRARMVDSPTHRRRPPFARIKSRLVARAAHTARHRYIKLNVWRFTFRSPRRIHHPQTSRRARAHSRRIRSSTAVYWPRASWTISFSLCTMHNKLYKYTSQAGSQAIQIYSPCTYIVNASLYPTSIGYISCHGAVWGAWRV